MPNFGPETLSTVKSVQKGHAKKDRKLVFKTNNRLMLVKSIADCSKGGALCNTVKPVLKRPLMGSSESGLLRQVVSERREY